MSASGSTVGSVIPNGAGRRHSRTHAKKLFTKADLAEAMKGKVWLAGRAESLVDEIPSA